jgi:GNAT superfamily N-acetyltransferase
MIKEFNDFPGILYHEDKNWSRPLDAEVETIFDPLKNKHLHNGKIIRWLLFNEKNRISGRVAAFYSEEFAQSHDQPTGGVGFFDCINDQEAANMLFDVAREWLKSKGLVAMDGPTNPGMRDSFWGCLVDGFHEQVYNMPYNFPYYKDLYENYGFKNYFNQYTYRREFESVIKLHPAVRRSAERVLNNPDYEFRLIKKGDKRYAHDFRTIYNKAWDNFSGAKDITDNEAIILLKEMEAILDERLVIYGYYKGEPIAFFIMMPDIGQITRRFKGKWNLWNKLRFYLHLKVIHSVDRVVGRIFGVVPEHQGKGVEGALIIHFEKQVTKPGFPYKSLELNWIGDFNPVMMKVAEFIGASIYKTHVTFRYLFDQTQEFKRAPVVNRPVNQ